MKMKNEHTRTSGVSRKLGNKQRFLYSFIQRPMSYFESGVHMNRKTRKRFCIKKKKKHETKKINTFIATRLIAFSVS